MAQAVISLAESAVTDLQAILRWYEEQGVPEVGRTTVEKVLARIDALRTHPDLGRIVPEFGQPMLRELIEPPFRIVYRRDARRVRIVRVWRSERRLVLE